MKWLAIITFVAFYGTRFSNKRINIAWPREKYGNQQIYKGRQYHLSPNSPPPPDCKQLIFCIQLKNGHWVLFATLDQLVSKQWQKGNWNKKDATTSVNSSWPFKYWKYWKSATWKWKLKYLRTLIGTLFFGIVLQFPLKSWNLKTFR